MIRCKEIREGKRGLLGFGRFMSVHRVLEGAYEVLRDAVRRVKNGAESDDALPPGVYRNSDEEAVSIQGPSVGHAVSAGTSVAGIFADHSVC